MSPARTRRGEEKRCRKSYVLKKLRYCWWKTSPNSHLECPLNLVNNGTFTISQLIIRISCINSILQWHIFHSQPILYPAESRDSAPFSRKHTPNSSEFNTHRNHVWYIYLYIYDKHQPNVGKSTMSYGSYRRGNKKIRTFLGWKENISQFLKNVGNYAMHGCYGLDHLSYFVWFWAFQGYLAPERLDSKYLHVQMSWMYYLI